MYFLLNIVIVYCYVRLPGAHPEKGITPRIVGLEKNKRRGLDSLGIRKIERSETHLVYPRQLVKVLFT